ncbi:hypothetical protein AVEN_82395-1 [Araneus ventricosus]|uniref:Uncharacterized protein n=1 Tax=Araneus ventricosus TaxID=182803 RepID=A0A4Y2SMK9_ARAVE|nr:hypothetical protein AVEN_82395-1 [Araneus ventricosus]
MDRPQSQLSSKAVSNIDENNYSYHEGDKACSLLEMNELEIRVTRLEEIAVNLDLCANDGFGNMNLETQQHRFRESEQRISQLTENDANFSNKDYSNENTAFNLAPNSRFILSQYRMGLLGLL